MGCFMGCFGLSSNKKRRNFTRKILPRDQRICSYEPLHSSDPTDLSIVVQSPEKISDSNLRSEMAEEEEKKKEDKKTSKRVRFNMNVQTYEPTRYANEFTEDEKEEKIKKLEDLSHRSMYPSNYRYQNCLDTFEDEDEIGYGDSDLDDEDYYTDDETDEDEEVEVLGDEDITPLLNPVQNTAEWKVVKAKPVKVKVLMKENVEVDRDDQVKPVSKEIIVNTSLSVWVVSPKSLFKRSPILDITNVETR